MSQRSSMDDQLAAAYAVALELQDLSERLRKATEEAAVSLGLPLWGDIDA